MLANSARRRRLWELFQPIHSSRCLRCFEAALQLRSASLPEFTLDSTWEKDDDSCLMRIRLLILLTLSLAIGSTIAASDSNHVILTGGPALRKWENNRVKRDQHDRWWANFIRASTLRMVEIRKAYGPTAPITWIVYQHGYAARAAEDGKPYIKWINELAGRRHVTLRWVNSGGEAIRAINKHAGRSVVTFDYFGHSNKYCFLLD